MPFTAVPSATRAGDIDGLAGILIAILADGVEALHGETDRDPCGHGNWRKRDWPGAGSTWRQRNDEFLAALVAFGLERRYVRRRRRRRRGQQIFQNVLAAQHR